MDQKIDNRLRDCNVEGDYVGGNQTKNYYISMLQDNEREFVVTHNANIKPVSYFTGREMELQELRQRIEEGRKSVLVSGMGGIGKTHICRKLFEEYLNMHAEDENEPFRHIGYIEFNGDMGSSLQNCLKFKQQDRLERNQEAAWRELEYLAADGKLLLFVDNVDKSISADPGLQKLKEIPGAVVLTSRQASFSDEFESYRIGFLNMEQCVEIYEKIRFEGSDRKVDLGEVEDLEYVIENLAGRHTITVEHLAHLARTKIWNVKRMRNELEQRGFRLTFRKGGELVNIQESYEKLYDLSELTEAEQNILEAFSVFPYIPLAAETCNEWLLADAGADEEDDILIGLYQKGWLQFNIEQDAYSMHPVYSQFIYEKSRPKGEDHCNLVEEFQRILDMIRDDPNEEFYLFISFFLYFCDKMSVGKNERLARLRMNCREIRDEELKKAEENVRKAKENARKAEENLRKAEERAKLVKRCGDVVEKYEYEEPYKFYFNLLFNLVDNFQWNETDIVNMYFLVAWLEELGGDGQAERCWRDSLMALGESIWLL